MNQKIEPAIAETLSREVQAKIESSPSKYAYHGFAGWFPVTVHSTSPWHALFAENMFRNRPVDRQLNAAELPRIQVFHDPYGKVSDYSVSFPHETGIILDPVDLRITIVGTAYAGEIKKSVFTMCNFKLPEYGILPMHSSANCLEDGSESCVIFGLSGTGKTTLSASEDRWLIGDDEIVWSEEGLSNLEGGCYAKLVDLDREKEPEIFSAVNRYGSILENVVMDEKTREVDFFDIRKTENTRGSYALSSLGKTFHDHKEAAHPKTIVFLTADAFGALPAVARLNPYEAQYHFIMGYTAKVAGTEMGVTEPKAAFSACFGEPFMPRPASVYAKMLAEKAQKHQASIWLLNTGWHGGAYGVGKRFPIPVTRSILTAIQSGELDGAKMVKHPIFGFEVPTECPGVVSKYLEIPKGEAATALAQKFIEHTQNLKGPLEAGVIERGAPQL